MKIIKKTLITILLILICLFSANAAPKTYGVEVSPSAFQQNDDVFISGMINSPIPIKEAKIQIYNQTLLSKYLEVSLNSSDLVGSSFNDTAIVVNYKLNTSSISPGTYSIFLLGCDQNGCDNLNNGDNGETFIVVNDSVMQDIIIIENQITNINQTINQTNIQITNLNQTINNQINNISSNVTIIKNNITKINTDITNIENNISNLYNNITNINITSIRNKILTLNQSINSSSNNLNSINSSFKTLEDKFNQLNTFKIIDISNNKQNQRTYNVSINTTLNASCEIKYLLDNNIKTNTNNKKTHTLEITDSNLGLNIYEVNCIEEKYNFEKTALIFINVESSYKLDLSPWFKSTKPSFLMSLIQLQSIDTIKNSNYSINSVLSSSAGPNKERLNISDVNMIWAYNGSKWTSYNVSNAIGDFQGFDNLDFAYYILDIKDTATGKTIRHK